MDRDEISDKFKILPDWTIYLSYIPLIAATASDRLCHQHNLFSFDRNFMKLAANMDINKISDNFKNRPDWIMYFRVTSP